MSLFEKKKINKGRPDRGIIVTFFYPFSSFSAKGTNYPVILTNFSANGHCVLVKPQEVIEDESKDLRLFTCKSSFTSNDLM